MQATLDYFSLVNVLPFTYDALQHLEKLRAEKVRIGTQDLRIAAIVLSVNGILVTSNRRDFDKVPGPVIEDWSQKNHFFLPGIEIGVLFCYVYLKR
ncbi:MAG: hypothetical protein DRI57_03980 [Deltaproteobacteria bacterium]|nr:MAG: hypothetical protein DRI57_03980 [Deltaproteobacteria bacterium]